LAAESDRTEANIISYPAANTPIPRQRVTALQDPLPFGGVDQNDEALSRADIDLRQLRHHTKNTLQRILGLIGKASALYNTPEGERIARDLEHRICLSATISNALFGLTGAPGSMGERLRQLGGSIVGMMQAPDQTIRIAVSVRGTCPAHLHESVLRSAHELIGNAVKHGLKDRPAGRIAVRLNSGTSVTTLAVVDNGWGCPGRPREGEGLALARAFVAQRGGTLHLESSDGMVATLELPHCR
jgi:two-component sensor histidine kinase